MKFDELKDWVKVIRKNCETTISCAWQEGNLEAWTFHRGKAEALEDFANMLTKIEQDLTLKELSEFCENTGCDYCPFASSVTNNHGELKYISCTIVKTPHHFKINDITQKVRETRK